MSSAETAQNLAQKRLFFDAYALIASTVLNAGAGLITYSLSSKVFSAEVLSAAIGMSSAMLLISGVAQLDLTNVLHRYLPRSGRSAARLILGSYAIAALASFVLAALFVALFGGPIFQEHQTSALIWFSLAVVAWSLFNLQDQVLMGLGAAWLVPVENAIHGLARIGLIIAVAVVGGGPVAIFSTWVLPVIVLLVVISIVIVRRVLPNHLARVGDVETVWDVRTVSRFAASGYVGGLSGLVLANLLPLLVLQHLGEGNAAYFQIPWMVASVVDLVAFNFGSSLVVQGASHQEHIPHLLRSAFRRQVVVLVPCLLVLSVVSDPLLRLVSAPEYAEASSTMLTLLAIGLIPRLVWGVYLPAVRLAGNIRAIALSQTLTNLGVLAAAIVGLYVGGLTGIGVGYLVAQCVIAAFTGPRLWKMLRVTQEETSVSTGEKG